MLSGSQSQSPRNLVGKLETPACLRHTTAKVNFMALLQIPGALQTVETMLPKANSVREIKELSIVGNTKKEKISAFGKIRKTVMEGSCDGISSLF